MVPGGICVVSFLDVIETFLLDWEVELPGTVVVGLCCPPGWLSVLSEVVGWRVLAELSALGVGVSFEGVNETVD